MVMSNGQVRCWGSNSHGQLGDGREQHEACPGRGDPTPRISEQGSHDCSTSPVIVAGIRDAVEVAVGDAHACALHRDGHVSCWGSDVWGAIGDTRTDHATCSEGRAPHCVRSPVRVDGLTDAALITAGGPNTCAIRRADGRLVCWGDNGLGQLGDGISTHHECALTEEITGDCAHVPVAVSLDEAVVGVTVGLGHMCAWNEEGALYCWGANLAGQVSGADDTVTTPRRVALPAPVQTAAAGSSHTCAVLRDGSVYCWGHNIAGQVGVPFSETALPELLDPYRHLHRPNIIRQPRQVSIAGSAESLVLGHDESCALVTSETDDGPSTRGVWCWGMTTAVRGQPLDSGAYEYEGRWDDHRFLFTVQPSARPLRATEDIGDVVQLVGSATVSPCVMTRHGERLRLHCWGANSSGQLGVGAWGSALPWPNARDYVDSPTARRAHIAMRRGSLVDLDRRHHTLRNRLRAAGSPSRRRELQAEVGVLCREMEEVTAVTARCCSRSFADAQSLPNLIETCMGRSVPGNSAADVDLRRIDLDAVPPGIMSCALQRVSEQGGVDLEQARGRLGTPGGGRALLACTAEVCVDARCHACADDPSIDSSTAMEACLARFATCAFSCGCDFARCDPSQMCC